jgi:hypothetical protein
MSNTVCIYRQSIQVGAEEWDMECSTLRVTDEMTIGDIRAWLKGLGVNHDNAINGVRFGNYASGIIKEPDE